MSVIVVKNNEDCIELASDSQETYSESDMVTIDWCKIRNIDDNVYVGAVGNAHITNLFFAYIEKYSVDNIVMPIDLIEYFSQFYNWASEIISSTGNVENLSEILGSSQFIIIIKNNIWQFNNFYIRKIDKINDYMVIGSGSTPALVALELGFSVMEALEIACKNNIYCSTPINYIKIKK